LLLALLGDYAGSVSTWLRQHQHAIAVTGGLLLIAIGVAEIAGWWQSWVTWLQVHVPQPSLPL
jgi:hypothetical protein